MECETIENKNDIIESGAIEKKNDIIESGAIEKKIKFKFTLFVVDKIINTKNGVLNNSINNLFISQFENLSTKLKEKYIEKYDQLIKENEIRKKNYSDFMITYNKIKKLIYGYCMNDLQLRKIENLFCELRDKYNKLCDYYKKGSNNFIYWLNKIIVDKHMFNSCHINNSDELNEEQNKKIQKAMDIFGVLEKNILMLNMKVEKLNK